MKFDLSECIKILNRTPFLIDQMLLGLSDELIFSNEGGDTWSPYDIVGHLIHGELTDWIPRAEIILDDNLNKNFMPFDRFAQIEISKGSSLIELLKEFRNKREQNVQRLLEMNIDAVKLKKTGIHPDLGEVTLKQLLSTWIVHDLSHINQMSRVIAKNFKGEIGPWKAYISIMQ
jgi:hypothetical protein